MVKREARAQLLYSPDLQPRLGLRFPRLMTVDSRCFEMMSVLFPSPRGPSSRQCRAADEVRGVQSIDSRGRP